MLCHRRLQLLTRGGDVVLINRQFIGPSDLAVPVISSGVFASIRRSRYVFGDVRVRDEG